MMKKNVKRKITCALACAIALASFGTAGCGTGSKTFPEYAKDKQFYIAGWGGPYATVEDYKLAKEAGFDNFVVSEHYSATGAFQSQEALDLGKEVGIKSVLHIGNHYGMHGDALHKYDTDYNQFKDYTERICYWDEPIYADLDTLADWAKEHDEKYGADFDFYVNLLNADMGLAEMGNTPETQNFEAFVEAYCSRVLSQIKTGKRILSADCYPLPSTKNQPYIRTRWLYTLETAMRAAQKYNAKHEEFIQITKHDSYGLMTEEGLRFQFYVLLNFQTTGFTYFTYSSNMTGYSDSCINLDKSGSLNPQYYYAKTVNAEIKAFEHIYMNYKVDGVMPVYGWEHGYETDEETGEVFGNTVMDMMKYDVKSIDGIAKIESSEDALVSGMSDKDGNKALVITNFSNPYHGLYNTVELTFEKGEKVTRLAVFRKGTRKVYEVKDNKITLELDPGEGVFAMMA